MDDLDKQLAELQMLADKEKLQHGTLGKKIGPAVPPKPKKATQPLVPQSYSINQQVEPSYSGRLNTTAQYYANIGTTPLLLSNQQQYANLPNNTNNLINSNIPTNHYANLQMNQQHQQAQPMHISHAEPQQARLTNSLLNAGPKPYNSSPSPSPHTAHANNATYSNVISDGVIYSNLAHVPSGNVGGPLRGGGMGVIYSNVSGSGGGERGGGRRYSETDDLPPPPPPPPIVSSNDHHHVNNALGGGLNSRQTSSSSAASVAMKNSGVNATLADYAPCTVNTNLPPPPDDFPPPPSPVSSSYSELRRATDPIEQDGTGVYGGYGLGSQSSSTYESIYEPINPPRPPSQQSSRSNYSLYTPYGGSTSGGVGAQTTGGPSPSASRMDHHHHQSHQPKVAEEDMMAQGQAGHLGTGEDVYGVCVKCGDKVVGENSGCTAMEQIYHTKCFTCHHCAINLQGKPFYSLDGNPYCKEDYLNTLEKCCVCMNPILDRILRATGKPYHPKCFTCVICGKSLDGIPFTVDATNQIHCIDDFHKKFAPRCCVCHQPIMPEPGQEETVRVVALDRSFHIQCYKCEDCGLVLSSEAEGRGCYPLDNHVLCKSCNAKRVQALTSHMTTDL